jgi:ubiquinone/menaquinone biosynthesis C-methylase UbiE
LDVGCGTGKPLKAIVDALKRQHSTIVGVDMHPEYTQKAIRLFEMDERVEIYNMDFYKIEDYLRLHFRFIFFSFSFMLMPDTLKALEIAKRMLEKHEDSRIAFVLTLNKNKNSFLSWLKPAIKRFTSIDFGQVVYEDVLNDILDQAGLEVTKKMRVEGRFNPFLMLSPVYYI